MIDFFTSKKIKRLILLVAILLLPILLCFCSSDEDRVTEIKFAEVKNESGKVKVEITLSNEDIEALKNEKLFLASLESDSLSEGVEIIGKTKAKKKIVFTLKAENMDDDFLSSALALVSQSTNQNTGEVSYTLITAPEYIANVSAIASQNLAPLKVGDIKGLSGSDALTAASVGATRTIIEVNIADLMIPNYADGAINYVFNGNSYYFDGEAVALLDKQVREANLLLQRVYLRTVITASDEESNTGLICSGSAPNSATGLAPASDSPEAMRYLRAFYSFIGERYSQNDMSVTDYIIGSSVNRFEKNCYAASSEKFEDAYFTWLSVAGNILLSKNKNINLYVSVDNRLRTEDSGALGAKVFLQKLSSRITASGNIPFNIAISLGEGDDLGDILSGNNKDLSLVNANSFPLLFELTASEEMLYNGKERGVIIDALSLPTSLSEQNRACYYAYTYYKAAEAGIDALFLTANKNGTIYSEAGARHDLFNAVVLCGTSNYSELNKYLGKISNSSLPNLSNYIFSTIKLEDEVSCEISSSANRNKKDFKHGLSELMPIGSSFDAMLSSKDNSTSLTVSSDIMSGAGAVVITEITGKEIIESGYIGISMYCDNVCDVELAVYNGREKARAIYIGQARVGSIEKTYYFKITEFTDEIKASDKITIALISPSAAEYSEDSLTITDISLYGNSGNGITTLIAIIVVVALALGACILLFILAKKRKTQLKPAKNTVKQKQSGV